MVWSGDEILREEMGIALDCGMLIWEVGGLVCRGMGWLLGRYLWDGDGNVCCWLSDFDIGTLSIIWYLFAFT